MGATAKVAPQALTPAQLRSVFDQFATAPSSSSSSAADDHVLSLSAFGDMLRALGVEVAGAAELRRVFNALDGDASGGVTHAEWAAWWAQNVADVAQTEPVRLILSSEQLETILDEEPPGKLICLEVRVTTWHRELQSAF